MPRGKDLTGQRYGLLTAIRFTQKRDKTGRYIWLFQCDCGATLERPGSFVTSGHCKSCGCLKGLYKDAESLAYEVFQDYRDGDLTFADFMRLSQQPCFYCDAPPSNTRWCRNKRWSFTYSGLDRISNCWAHVASNVVPACVVCNFKKSAWDFDAFWSWLQKVHANLS